MSIQWTFIAGFLYAEIILVFLLVLPIFSPRIWHNIFQSRFLTSVKEHTSMYFYSVLVILALFLFDSVREITKYSHSTDSDHRQLASEMKGNVKLFRAQRNFYITGFAIFLTFVIKRIITMILIQYQLQVAYERVTKKLEGAVRSAENEPVKIAEEKMRQKLLDMEQSLEVSSHTVEEQKLKLIEIKEEAMTWKHKYEELKRVKDGKGDN